jgi:hypothetical protein
MVIGENMLQEFITQNYLIIEQNVVTNIVIWNGDTSQWTPPQGSIALTQGTTPFITWEPVFVNGKVTDFENFNQLWNYLKLDLTKQIPLQ